VPRSSYPRVTVLAVTRRAPRHRAGALGSVEGLDTHPRLGIAAVTRPVQEGRCLVSSERSDIFRAPAGETNGRSVTFVVCNPPRARQCERTRETQPPWIPPPHPSPSSTRTPARAGLPTSVRATKTPPARPSPSLPHRESRPLRRARRLPFADATRVSASPTSQVACSPRGCSRRRLGYGSRTRATRYAPEASVPRAATRRALVPSDARGFVLRFVSPPSLATSGVQEAQGVVRRGAVPDPGTDGGAGRGVRRAGLDQD